jgi:hypothetical protein
MANNHSTETLQRIQSAMEAARVVFSRFTAGAIEAEYKIGHDPVDRVLVPIFLGKRPYFCVVRLLFLA